MEIISGTLLNIIAVGIYYFSSQKIELDNNRMILFLQSKKALMRGLALLATILSVVFVSTVMNVAAAILSVTVVWMILASMFTLFAPSWKDFNIYLLILMISASVFSLIF